MKLEEAMMARENPMIHEIQNDEKGEWTPELLKSKMNNPYWPYWSENVVNLTKTSTVTFWDKAQIRTKGREALRVPRSTAALVQLFLEFGV